MIFPRIWAQIFVRMKTCLTSVNWKKSFLSTESDTMTLQSTYIAYKVGIISSYSNRFIESWLPSWLNFISGNLAISICFGGIPGSHSEFWGSAEPRLKNTVLRSRKFGKVGYVTFNSTTLDKIFDCHFGLLW